MILLLLGSVVVWATFMLGFSNKTGHIGNRGYYSNGFTPQRTSFGDEASRSFRTSLHWLFFALQRAVEVMFLSYLKSRRA